MDVTCTHFRSHENKLWHHHVQEVEAIAKKKGAPLDKKTERMLEIIIRSHDFGKLTDFFQDKLKSKTRKDILEARHSLYSAIFAAFWAFKETALSTEEVLLIFNIVVHHHSNLSYVNRLLPKGSSKNVEELQKQFSLNNILPGETKALFLQFQNQKKNQNQVIRSFVATSSKDKHTIMDFLSSEQSIVDTLSRLRKGYSKFSLSIRKQNGDLFTCHQLLYSLLIDSDIISASDTEERPDAVYSNQDVQQKRNEYLAPKGNVPTKPISPGRQQLNKMRTMVFNKVIDTIHEKVKGSGIYTITSPCGSGKTITGFSAAVEIRELLMRKDQKNRKIIYALPFTTLITQNTGVMKNLLPVSDEMSMEEQMSYIIQHHYLTPYVEESEEKIKTEKILLENWNSGVIVTTFVQLFDALVGHRKRSLKKLNSLRNAVVILDEVQSLPFRYWRFISYLFELYTKELGITFIIMTATKPELCKHSATELLPTYQDVFKMVNRTKIVPILDVKYTIEELVEKRIVPSIEEAQNHHLIVMNTIDSSIMLFEMLRKYYKPEQLYYLSTNLTPNDRKIVVDEVSKKLKQNHEPIILVSTQVIEAGVDVDFDVVFREISPLDSIIQTSGRGNRNNEKKQAPIYIFQLDSKGEKIYIDVLIEITRQLLERKTEIEEVYYLELIQEYFSSVSEKTNDEFEIFKKYVQKIQHNEKNKGLCEFQLIEERDNAMTVLVQQTKDVQDLYINYKNSPNKITREVLGKQLQEFIVTIPKKYCERMVFDEETNYCVIPYHQLNIFYDSKTGIIR